MVGDDQIKDEVGVLRAFGHAEVVDGAVGGVLAVINCPALTSSRPACAARIFCVMVIPTVITLLYRFLMLRALRPKQKHLLHLQETKKVSIPRYHSI